MIVRGYHVPEIPIGYFHRATIHVQGMNVYIDGAMTVETLRGVLQILFPEELSKQLTFLVDPSIYYNKKGDYFMFMIMCNRQKIVKSIPFEDLPWSGVESDPVMHQTHQLLRTEILILDTK